MLYGIDFYNEGYVLKRKGEDDKIWYYLDSFDKTRFCKATWTGVKEQVKIRSYYEVAEILKWFIDRNPHMVSSVLVEIK